MSFPPRRCAATAQLPGPAGSCAVQGACSNNGKENGNYYSLLGLYCDSGIMETTIIYWGYIGMMEKKMETTVFRGIYVLIQEKQMETAVLQGIYWVQGSVGLRQRIHYMGLIQDLDCRVHGLGFGVTGLGLKFRLQGWGFRAPPRNGASQFEEPYCG